MNASRLFGRFLQAMWGLRARRAARPAASPAETAVAFAPAEPVGPAMPFAPSVHVAPGASRSEPPQPPTVPMRSLDEVRADLARLREKARQRQAQVQVRRDLAFAPTDFMALAEPPKRSRGNPEPGFVPVEFFDFGAAKR